MWGKLDDKFWSHRKVLAAGNEATGAFVRMLSYCCDHGTEGKVEPPVAWMIGCANTLAIVAKLVEVGLLDPTEGGGWMVHDFAVYNPTATAMAKRREEVSEKRREAGKRGAQNRWQTPTGDGKPDGKPDGKAMANGMATDGIGDGKPMAPRASDPVPFPNPEVAAAAARARGSAPDLDLGDDARPDPPAKLPPTTDATTDADALEVLQRLEARSKGLFMLDGTPEQRRRFVDLLRAVHGCGTAAALDAAGDALADPKGTWPGWQLVQRMGRTGVTMLLGRADAAGEYPGTGVADLAAAAKHRVPANDGQKRVIPPMPKVMGDPAKWAAMVAASKARRAAGGA